MRVLRQLTEHAVSQDVVTLAAALDDATWHQEFVSASARRFGGERPSRPHLLGAQEAQAVFDMLGQAAPAVDLSTRLRRGLSYGLPTDSGVCDVCGLRTYDVALSTRDGRRVALQRSCELCGEVALVLGLGPLPRVSTLLKKDDLEVRIAAAGGEHVMCMLTYKDKNLEPVLQVLAEGPLHFVSPQATPQPHTLRVIGLGPEVLYVLRRRVLVQTA